MRALVLIASLLVLMRSMTWTAECQDTKRVKVTAESGFWRSRKQEGYDNYLSTSVIYDIKYYCSASQAKNLVFLDLQGAITSQGNSTTIWVTQYPQPIGTYFLNCTDTMTGCSDSVTVQVFPAVTAISQHSRVNMGNDAIFVPLGEFYEVICTGTQAELLTIILNEQVIETVILNKTSVKSVKLHESVISRNVVHCHGRESTVRQSNYTGTAIVYVDYPPAATDFRCVENKRQVITCTWKIISIDVSYELLVNKDGSFSAICDGNQKGYVTKELTCETIMTTMNYPTLDFTLQTCNIVFCNEQRFFYNRKSIRKPSPPFLLKRLNTSSHSAFVEFHVNTLDEYKDSAFDFKVEYKLYGVISHALDASSLRVNCSFFNIRVSRCELEMTLPCPSAFYKVKIYVKPIQNLYWSDPAPIQLYTTPQDGSTGSVNAVCTQKYEPITNKERGIIANENLELEFFKSNLGLKRKVDDMKPKIPEVKALRQKFDEL